MMCGLDLAAKQYAKSIWLPVVLKDQSELFNSSESLINQDGLRGKQIKDKLLSGYPNSTLQAIDDNITRMESLLDLPPTNCDLQSRLARLEPYFKGQ
jgi:hypothetical protein